MKWSWLAHQRTLWLVLGAIFIVAGTATATGVVINQTLSSTNAINLLTNNCPGYNLVEETPYVATITGNLTYDCGAGVPAFQVGPFSSTVHYFYAVPTFTLPSPMTYLFVVIPGSAGTGTGGFGCAAYYGTAYQLVSGTAVEFQGGGPSLSWDYCADVTLGNFASIPSVSVSWSY